jgi:hypothetical protein
MKKCSLVVLVFTAILVGIFGKKPRRRNKMGILSNFKQKLISEMEKARINAEIDAFEKHIQRERRLLEFPFTSDKPVTPGLYWVVSHSNLKSRGIFRWRMTAGRGYSSFNIDFPTEMMLYRTDKRGFNAGLTGIYQQGSVWNSKYNSSASVGYLVELTATHAIPRDITKQERDSANPKN